MDVLSKFYKRYQKDPGNNCVCRNKTKLSNNLYTYVHFVRTFTFYKHLLINTTGYANMFATNNKTKYYY
jgi:hypothetical protein